MVWAVRLKTCNFFHEEVMNLLRTEKWSFWGGLLQTFGELEMEKYLPAKTFNVLWGFEEEILVVQGQWSWKWTSQFQIMKYNCTVLLGGPTLVCLHDWVTCYKVIMVHRLLKRNADDTSPKRPKQTNECWQPWCFLFFQKTAGPPSQP